jgi:putative protease
MIDAGIDSFKVEGRTKSLYYVSAVAKAYREAIDLVLQNPDADMQPYFEELLKVGNRGYTTGFYLGNGEYPSDGYSYDVSKGLAGADFLCEIHNKENGYYRIITKNKFFKNEDIELITPTEKIVTQVTEIIDLKGEEQELANTNHELLVKLSKEPQNWEYGLIRTVGIKNGVNEAAKCACS